MNEQMNEQMDEQIDEQIKREVFPTLQEQMDALSPELQVAIHLMEEEYDNAISNAKNMRGHMIKITSNLLEANRACKESITEAIGIRNSTINSLREKWGKFFYDNIK